DAGPPGGQRDGPGRQHHPHLRHRPYGLAPPLVGPGPAAAHEVTVPDTQRLLRTGDSGPQEARTRSTHPSAPSKGTPMATTNPASGPQWTGDMLSNPEIVGVFAAQVRRYLGDYAQFIAMIRRDAEAMWAANPPEGYSSFEAWWRN